MLLGKFSKLKIINPPGKNLLLTCPVDLFTKTEFQITQLKLVQLPPHFEFAILQNNTLQPVHYLIKHEEV